MNTDSSAILVLFVDDSHGLAAAFSAAFAAHGVRVTTAAAGFAAHEVAMRLLPDAVLIGSSAGTAEVVLMLDQFRAEASTRHIPVVVMSNVVASEAMTRLLLERLLQAGATEIIREPTTAAHVFETVHRRTRRSPASRQVLELRRQLARARETAAAQRIEAAAMRTRAADLFARMQHLHAAMLAADPTGQCVSANAAAAALCGRAPEDIVGRKVWALAATTGEQRLDEAWPSFLDSGLLEAPCAIVRADGTRIEAELFATTHVVPGLHVIALEPLHAAV